MDKATADKSAQVAKTFDPHHLVAQTGGDTALQRELLTLFEAQSFAILTALGQSSAPTQTHADLAHQLAGSAQAVGAFALAEIAIALETQLRTGRAAPDALNRLPGAAEAALVAIRRRRAELF
jgi:HPt (histidine-containing phosphotransfer) domain-containing protein